jgi:hypothetical protein
LTVKSELTFKCYSRLSKVGLPYHKPRPRTLDEFLNRKKNAPYMKIMDIKKLTRGVVNTEDIIAAEKLLEERERMAVEFFKTDEDRDEQKEESNGPTNQQPEEMLKDGKVLIWSVQLLLL